MNSVDFWNYVAEIRGSPNYMRELPKLMQAAHAYKWERYTCSGHTFKDLGGEIITTGWVIGVKAKVIAGCLLMELRDLKRRNLL